MHHADVRGITAALLDPTPGMPTDPRRGYGQFAPRMRGLK